jgi:hypothetical protein
MRAPHRASLLIRRSLLVRSGLAALPAAAVAALGCQGQAALTESNPASNAIWWVSGAIFLVLLVILAVEVSGAAWSAWRRLRGHDQPPRR